LSARHVCWPTWGQWVGQGKGRAGPLTTVVLQNSTSPMPWYLLMTWFAHRVTQMSRRSPQYLHAGPSQARLWLHDGQTLAGHHRA